ncbi:DUF859 family phage minor structural protein [Abiotrophia defectiva]|uniref:DUF859 family phage minor structural protein n=1 Tax=Abiotrophia defectiva TaxID=46125 RepID=UPI0026EAA89C|nr:DUF859 family phage minor structural protein [Abiotrophia defectiva]
MASEWTQYDAKVVGTGSLGTRFRIKADEPDSTAKTVKIYWEAWLTANPAAGYYDAAEGTPCDLFLGQNQVYNKRTVFDLRNGLSEQKIAEGSHTVSYSDAPDGSITFSWTFDGRAYWDQIKQPTIISGKFQLPELTVDYTPTTDKAEYMLGEPVIITTNAPNAEYTHDISYLSQGKTQTDIQKGVTDRVQWTVPEDEVLQAPTTTFFNITIKVDAKKDGKVLFSKNLTIKVNIPEDVKPKINRLYAYEKNEKVKDVDLGFYVYLRLMSKVKVSFLNSTIPKGTSVSKAIVRIKEKPEYTVYADSIQDFFLPPFPFPESGIEEITIQGAIVDSRGRMSDWAERKIKVLAYSPPTIGAITPIRSGDTVLMKRNWSVSSIEPKGPGSEKNTATLSFFVRPQGGEWVENTGANATALSGKDSEATLLGTFPGNAYFEVKVRLSDKLATVEAGPFNIPTEGFPVSVSANNKVGINKLVDKNGAQVQIAGESMVMSLEGSEYPFFEIKRGPTRFASIGFMSKRNVDYKELIIRNDAIGRGLVMSDNMYFNGRKLAYEDPFDNGDATISMDNLTSGFNRLRDKGPRKDEYWSLSQTWLSASKAEGFQIAWLPMKNVSVLYRRTKHGGVWKAWKEF